MVPVLALQGGTVQVLSEAELDTLHDIKEKYWEDFSALVRRALLEAPRELRPHLLVMLEESSSCHGSKYVGRALQE